jgi:nucleoid-associated protein YgaU
MRTDVKIGLFLGIAALLLAGWLCWPTGTNRTPGVGEAGRPVTVSVTPIAPAPVAAADAPAPSPIGPSVAMGSPSPQVPVEVSAPPVAPGPVPTEVSGPAAIGREPLVHVVGNGQTLEQIAEFYYKDGDKPYDQNAAVALLRQANPRLASGKQPRAGTKIKIPTAVPVVSSFPSAGVPVSSPTTQPASVATIGGRSYTVQRGDTLYSIASKQLGTPKRWHEVLDLNGVTLNGKPQALRPGQVLRLPG